MNSRAKHRSGRRYVRLLGMTLALLIGTSLGISLLADLPDEKPDRNVTVTSFKPEGETDNRTNIDIVFSNDLVPADSIDRPITEVPVSFDPPIPALARWVATDQIRIFPDEPLLPATKYVARVSSKADWVRKNRINERRKFEFNTEPLRVTGKRHNSQRSVDSTDRAIMFIDLTFNYPVKMSELRRKISIEGVATNSRGRLDFVVGPADADFVNATQDQFDDKVSSRVLIRTQGILINNRNQRYRLNIKSGLLCDNCSDNMPGGFAYDLILSSRPSNTLKIEGVSAGSRYEAAGQIEISFSHRVDRDEAEGNIFLDPPVPFQITSNYRGIKLIGEFKPGETYDVQVKAGLWSRGLLMLERDYSGRVVIPDMNPYVKFNSRGVFLPRNESKLLEIETVNIDTISVEIEQVFEQNLLYYLTGGRSDYYYDLGRVGRRLYVHDLGLSSKENEVLKTTVDIGSMVGDSLRGVFRVAVRNKHERWNSQNREVMLTDIGIAARKTGDRLMVWLNSLSTIDPIGGASVRLYSRNNQVLQEATSNYDGVAQFESIGQFTKEMAPFAVLVQHGNDIAYLKFSDTRLSTSDFDASGRPYLVSGYDAYLYTDRGVYRPGETAHIVSVVRGPEVSTPEEFPYRVVLTDPRGKDLKTFRLTTADDAVGSIDFDLDPGAMTGKYIARAKIDKRTIGQVEFLVEEFMPDRIKTEVKPTKEEFAAGEEIAVDIIGTFLFGPPTSKHPVSGMISLESQRFTPDGYSKYSFSNSKISYAKNDNSLPDTLLDADGRHTYKYQLPADIAAPSALKATVWATVSEHGGRGVSNFAQLVVHPYERYIGVKTNLDGYAAVDQPVELSLVALDSRSQPSYADSIKVKMYRLTYNSVWRRNSQGRYGWISEERQEMADSAWVNVKASGATASFIPQRYGRYRVIAEDLEGGHSSSVEFYAAGWGYVPWSMADPDKVKMDLDHKTYVPGDTAMLQIRAPFAGKLLLTIEREQVLDYLTLTIDSNTATIPIAVKPEFFPNVYLTATLIKPAKAIETHTPARAFGMLPLVMDLTAKSVPIVIEAPEVMKPRQKITVNLTTEGKPHSTVTLAAVDAGILQLTGFETPDPLNHYYGKRRALVEAYDIYSYIYPEVPQAESHLSPSGGMSRFDSQRKRQLNPFASKRVKPVALWSGVVKTDAYGKATVELDVPDFNGKLILVAVATRGDHFGAESAETTVRDKIVLMESFPRFVSPNDITEGLVTVFNNMGEESPIRVTLTLDGPAAVFEEVELTDDSSVAEPKMVKKQTQVLTLEDGSEGLARFKFKADQVPGVIKVRIDGASGAETAHTEFELSNRPAQPLSSVFSSGIVNDSMPASIGFSGQWIEGTDQYIIKTSSLAAVAYTRNIEYLLRYPYGCVEQTTSRLFPLLYFSDLAKFVKPELFGGKGHEYFIGEGIDKLTSMQRSDGSFSYWPGGHYVHNWASIYAANFFVEAKLAGYEIDNQTYERVINHLTDVVRNRSLRNLDPAQQVYAAYGMAKAGRIDKKTVNWLKEFDQNRLPIYARYLLAGAVGMSGDIDFARSRIPLDIQPDLTDPETGGNFSSGVRSTAIMLDVLLEVDPGNPAIGVLAESLAERARANQWYSTQSNSWALMALGKLFANKDYPTFTGSVDLSDGTSFPIDSSKFELIRNDLAGKRVNISVEGAGDCYYYWLSSGMSPDPVSKEFTRGIKIRRDYLDERGLPLDRRNVKLGQQAVVRITIEAPTQRLENVVINDMLPAGFEIENPRLKNSPRFSWVPRQDWQFDHMDIRDDRLLMFMTLPRQSERKIYYVVRAIAAGEFKVPSVAAECMYNPVISGAGSSNVVTIHGPQY